MEITIINKTNNEHLIEYQQRFEEIAHALVEYLKYQKQAEVSIIFVDAQEIHQINKEFRKIDRPTDVITFAALDGNDNFNWEETIELGDIFINQDAAIAQAKQYEHSLEREICFLFIHGLLHTLGYDHLTKEDEDKMFAIQSAVLDPIISR